MLKKSLYSIVFAAISAQPVVAYEISGVAIESREYVVLVQDIAHCKALFEASLKYRAYELQFEVDEEKFSDEKLQDDTRLVSSAEERMLEVEKRLPLKHRKYLEKKRKRSYLEGGVYGELLSTSEIVRHMRDCMDKAELVLK